MRRRSKILILGACGLIALVAVCFFCLRDNDKQPTYKGRKLSEWLEQCPRVDDVQPANDRERQAVVAVRQIGSNAVPTLLRWRYAIDPVRMQQAQQKVAATPGWVRRSEILERIYYEGIGLFVLRPGRDARHQYLARIGFHILRTNALPFLPELIRDFQCATNFDDVTEAADSIRCLGSAGVAPLVAAASSSNDYPHRFAAITALSEMEKVGTNAAPAVPVLLEAVQGPDSRISGRATLALANLRLLPDEVVPVLTNRLTSTNAWARGDAVRALRGYTNYIRSAVPILKLRLTDPDVYVRELTTNLLAEFVPEMVPNALRDRERYGLLPRR